MIKHTTLILSFITALLVVVVFANQSGAKKLILENTISPPVPSKEMRKVSVKIQKHLEKNLTLPSMFNKEEQDEITEYQEDPDFVPDPE